MLQDITGIQTLLLSHAFLSGTSDNSLPARSCTGAYDCFRPFTDGISQIRPPTMPRSTARSSVSTAERNIGTLNYETCTLRALECGVIWVRL